MTALDERPTTRSPSDDPHTPWRLRAACNGVSIAIFFPHRANTADANTAAAYCRTCPVADHCETDAIAAGCRTFGVWAGRYWDEGRSHPITEPPRLATEERITLAKQRRREALTYWGRIRPGHRSDYAAECALAEHYGVTRETARNWVKRARVEAEADYAAAKAALEAETAQETA